MALTTVPVSVIAQQEALPHVVLIATGGTIAGEGSSATSGSYTASVATVDQMLNSVTGLSALAAIRGEQFCKIGSQDMTFDILIRLSRYINQLLAGNDVDAVVVTHGTDTMEETAFFLSLTVNSSKPVVLVGAMRPASSMGADGPLNLYNAVATAASSQSHNRGVLVVMNDLIFDAQSVIKMNTASVQAFQSTEGGAEGYVNYGHVNFFRSPVQHHVGGYKLLVDGLNDLPRVDIIYAYTGMQADLIESSVRLGAKGIVIAGVGNGNMNAPSLTACTNAVRQGIVVVRSSRVATGAVGRNIEINDDEAGFIVSHRLNPAKARVMLALLLVQSHTTQQIQEFFYQF